MLFSHFTLQRTKKKETACRLGNKLKYLPLDDVSGTLTSPHPADLGVAIRNKAIHYVNTTKLNRCLSQSVVHCMIYGTHGAILQETSLAVSKRLAKQIAS